jgi:hypothetical protein
MPLRAHRANRAGYEVIGVFAYKWRPKYFLTVHGTGYRFVG